MKAVLRWFSYLFQGLLALFLIAVSGFSFAAGGGSMRMEVLPWTGATLTYVVFFSALAGLIILTLAILGKVRWLFFVWTLVVFAFMVKGYVFSGYHFEPGDLSRALWLMAGALIALLGGWFQVRAPQPNFKKRY